jgi:hypothetical protein
MHYTPFDQARDAELAALQAAAEDAETMHEESYDLVFSRSLTANQALIDQALYTDGDSEFLITSVVGTSTGAYSIRLKGPTGRYLQSAAVRNTNFVGSAIFPSAILPALLLPANGRITLDVTDLSAAPNTIEILFRGIKRFPIR